MKEMIHNNYSRGPHQNRGKIQTRRVNSPGQVSPKRNQRQIVKTEGPMKLGFNSSREAGETLIKHDSKKKTQATSGRGMSFGNPQRNSGWTKILNNITGKAKDSRIRGPVHKASPSQGARDDTKAGSKVNDFLKYMMDANSKGPDGEYFSKMYHKYLKETKNSHPQKRCIRTKVTRMVSKKSPNVSFNLKKRIGNPKRIGQKPLINLTNTHISGLSPKKLFSPTRGTRNRNITSFDEIKITIKDLKKKNIANLKGAMQKIRQQKSNSKAANKTIQAKLDKSMLPNRKVKSPMIRHNALSPIVGYTDSVIKSPQGSNRKICSRKQNSSTIKTHKKIKIMKEETKQSRCFRKIKSRLRSKANENHAKKNKEKEKRMESMKRIATIDKDRSSIHSSFSERSDAKISITSPVVKSRTPLLGGRFNRRSTLHQTPFKLLSPSPLPQVDEEDYKKSKIKKMKTKNISKNDINPMRASKMSEAQLRRRITKVLKKINFDTDKDFSKAIKRSSSQRKKSMLKKSFTNKKLQRINTKIKEMIAYQKRRSSLPAFKINIISAEGELSDAGSSKNLSMKSVKLNLRNEKPRSENRSRVDFSKLGDLSENITEGSKESSSSTATFNDTISEFRKSGQEGGSISEDLN
ncbi:unnamed protein product [Moneuplotes crassus]|uniref:Uncharacterized protein n=1 Tax=Euplotes crassus TaxID=5936 RepID=A0AAD2CZE6_EUPCR|nr:unnamed protein product [Moneuplotes crassus]